MDSTSDSEKTDVDTSEIVPDAKERFYSEKTPPQKSVVLEADTPSSAETVIVSETASDFTTSVSETSSSATSLSVYNRADSFENKSKTDDNIVVSESTAVKLQINMTSTANIADLEKCLDATVESYIHLQKSITSETTEEKCNCEIVNPEVSESSNDSQDFHDCDRAFADNYSSKKAENVDYGEEGQCDIKEECLTQNASVETNISVESPTTAPTPAPSERADKEITRQNSANEAGKDAELVISSDDELTLNKSNVIELTSSDDDDVEEVAVTSATKHNPTTSPSFVQARSTRHFQNNDYLARYTSEANVELNRNLQGDINISVVTPSHVGGEFPEYQQPTMCYSDTHFANVSHFNISSQCTAQVGRVSYPHTATTTSASDNGNHISSLINNRRSKGGALKNPIELDCEDTPTLQNPIELDYEDTPTQHAPDVNNTSLSTEINLVDDVEENATAESNSSASSTTTSPPDDNVKILIDLMDDGELECTSKSALANESQLQKNITEEEDNDEEENSGASDLENISILIDLIGKGDDICTSSEVSQSSPNNSESNNSFNKSASSEVSDNIEQEVEKNDLQDARSDLLVVDTDTETSVVETKSPQYGLTPEQFGLTSEQFGLTPEHFELTPKQFEMETNCMSNQLAVGENMDNTSSDQTVPETVALQVASEAAETIGIDANFIGPQIPKNIMLDSNLAVQSTVLPSDNITGNSPELQEAQEYSTLRVAGKKRRKKKKKNYDYDSRSIAMYINDLMQTCPQKKVCIEKSESMCTTEAPTTMSESNLAVSNPDETRICVKETTTTSCGDSQRQFSETICVDTPYTQIVERSTGENFDQCNTAVNSNTAVISNTAVTSSNSNIMFEENSNSVTTGGGVAAIVDPAIERDVDQDSIVLYNIAEPTTETMYESCEYNLTQEPKQVAVSLKEFQSKRENHLRGCLWSPDGASILTNSDDNILRLFKIPDNLSDESLTDELCADMRMSEGETVYDMAWYPYMNSNDPSTCCFLSTSRDHPVHLWDALDGVIRCSYRAFDQMDELTSAHCTCFNTDGSKIYCGFDKCVRIFDSSRPGNECEERYTVAKKNQSKKGKGRCHNSLNQPGIISSIAFGDYCGLYALGSFSRTVGLYSVNDGKCTGLLNGHNGGVTQVKFTSDGYYLMSGARKDSEIIWWDLRNMTMPLFKLLRNVATNQRIQFDIDRNNLNVFSGGTDSMVNIWDLKSLPDEIDDEVISYQPTLQFSAHDDAVNAVSLHPTKALLASTSGQRHFFYDSDCDSPQQSNFDNCLKIWHL